VNSNDIPTVFLETMLGFHKLVYL